MEELQRAGEVTEASTTEFAAQCYELYQSPPLGSLVKTRDLPLELYGVVYNTTTASIDPGRRPIARGKDASSEEEIYRSSPQLLQLFRSEFSALVVGHRQCDRIYYYLPPRPARIHSFVYLCPPAEIKEFSRSLAFLKMLVTTRLPVPGDELIAACLRQISLAHEDRHRFLVTAGRELAALLGNQFQQLKSILERLKDEQ
jgi:hypothetical protein